MDSETIITMLIPTVLSLLLGWGFNWLEKIRKWRKDERKWRKDEIEQKFFPAFGDALYKLVKSDLLIPVRGVADNDNQSIPLVKVLLKEFSNSALGKRRYMILGETGLGKSTFSASLFYEYVKTKKNYSIYVKSLGVSENILNDLTSIKNKMQSILILDALDESYEAISNYDSFINQLDKVTNDFKFVVITCRIQFFSSDQNIPTQIQRIQPQGAVVRYQIFTICPFSDGEIETYLSRKYVPGKDSSKYPEACQIVKRCNDLMCRPLILSYLDDLLELTSNAPLSDFKIYKRIVDSWFSREIKIHQARGVCITESDLYQFTKKVAVYMVNKWQNRKQDFLTEEEYEVFMNENKYTNNPYSFEGRSLLTKTRDNRNIRFSHRSFLEFFLAIAAIEDPSVSINVDAFGMAIRFLAEVYESYLKKIQLENINYYPNLVNLNQEREKCQALQAALQQDGWHRNYQFWNFLVQCDNLEKILLLRGYEHFHEDSLRNNSIITRLPLREEYLSRCQYIKNINIKDLISTYQDYYCGKDVVWDEIKVLLEKQLEMIEMALANPPSGDSQFENFVIFPILYQKYEGQIKDKNQTLIIHIGSVYYGNDDLHDTIKKILEESPNKHINIYKKGDTIEEIVDFINSLNEIVTKALVQIVYNGKMCCYLINEHSKNYNVKDINKTLRMMFES